jgi:exo-1,4-beta-D-glucosaminidase
LLLRSSPERLEAELALVRDLGLNTLRLEGKLETDAFYAAADRYGIALIPGWMCCDRWQESKSWSAAEHAVARASTFDQARRLRNHPSVLSFMIGSDEAPAPDVERELVTALERADWSRPISAAAAERTTPLLGKTGVKMSGPYDWVSPYYWYEDRAFGGAFGFNTETSPGPALPELETLRAWLPEADLERLWSMPKAQQFHAGRNEFWDLSWFHRALSARHGKPQNIEDFSRKAQLMSYEAERALFESYSGKRYRSATGIVHWLANSAWPSLIWHLYAHDLSTAAGYFGAKKANEPLHLQYDYAERSVSLVNETAESAEVTARTQVLDLNGAVRFEHTARSAVAADSVAPVTTLPAITGLSSSYFVRLSATRDGRPLSDNWYWLSTRAERSAYARSDFFHAPVLSYADLTALGQLAPATLTAKARFEGEQLRVKLDNASPGLAFFVRLNLVDAAGQPLAPVLWDDNYVTLVAGEQQERTATLPAGSRWPDRAVLRVAGFNVAAQEQALPPRVSQNTR